eukprot:8447928-Pyramimonas_sp.AAC.1
MVHDPGLDFLARGPPADLAEKTAEAQFPHCNVQEGGREACERARSRSLLALDISMFDPVIRQQAC